MSKASPERSRDPVCQRVDVAATALKGSPTNKEYETEFYNAVAAFARRALARRYSQIPADHHDDMVQEGCLGARDAFARWNPEQSTFIRFANMRITGQMLDYARTASHLSRKQQRERRCAETNPYSQATWGSAPSVFQASQMAMYGDSFIGDGSRAIADSQNVTSRELSPDHLLNREAFWNKATEGLSDRDRALFLRVHRDGQTMKAAGAEVQLSESGVSIILARALRQIRDRLAVDGDEEILHSFHGCKPSRTNNYQEYIGTPRRRSDPTLIAPASPQTEPALLQAELMPHAGSRAQHGATAMADKEEAVHPPSPHKGPVEDSGRQENVPQLVRKSSAIEIARRFGYEVT